VTWGVSAACRRARLLPPSEASGAGELERANAALRTKNREANRAAKLSAARMAELEDEVARLQTQLAGHVSPAGRAAR
jgi:hypothetical protein